MGMEEWLNNCVKPYGRKAEPTMEDGLFRVLCGSPKGVWENIAKNKWGLQVHFYSKFTELDRPTAP